METPFRKETALRYKLMILLAVLAGHAFPEVYPDSVVATTSVGMNPMGVCCHPDGGTAYVAVGFGYLAVVDTGSWTLDAFVKAGESPSDVCITPGGDRVLVSDDSEDTVRVLDTSTNTFISSVHVPYTSHRIEATADGGFVAVLHQGGHLTLLDGEYFQVQGTYWVGYSPGGLCALPQGGTIYVSDRNSSSAGAFDTASRTLSRFFVGGDTYDVCALTGGDHVYMNVRDWDMISMVAVPENISDGEIFPVGSSPSRLCALGSGGYVYVTDDQQDMVSIISTEDASIVGTVEVGPGPTGICSSPSGDLILVTNSDANTLTAIGRSSTGVGHQGTSPGSSPTVYPSPCGGSAILCLELPLPGSVSVSVFSLDGRLLCVPVDGFFDAGSFEMGLDGLPAGCLFIEIETPSGRSVLPLVSL